MDYLYSRAQKCATAEERDGFTLALALLGAVRRSEPDPFTAASYDAFGSSLPVYRKRRAEQQWRQHAELVQTIEVGRREADARRVHTMQPATRSAKQEPVPPVPDQTKTAHA